MFFCEYALRPGKEPDDIDRRARDLHRAGTSHQDLIETWYTYSDEGAGFMVLHADDLDELQGVLESYQDILHYQIRPVLEEVNYEARVGVGRPSRGLAAVS